MNKPSFILFIGVILIAVAGPGFLSAQSPINGNTRLYFGDANGDGALDLIIGEMDLLRVYLNEGTPGSPEFGAVFYEMPVDDSFNRTCGAFCDIDLDGDLDLFFGNERGFVGYRRNTGTAASPDWSEVVYAATSLGTSFAGVNFTYGVWVLSFVDFDGDGDRDMVMNDSLGQIIYYKNMDRESDGWVDGQGATFVRITKNLPTTSCGGDSPKHHWCDVDGDGDFDLPVGTKYSGMALYRNNGSPSNYSSFSGYLSWPYSMPPGTLVSPFMEDFDNDGFLDLYYSTQAGDFAYISAATRSGPNDTDPAPPNLGASNLTVYDVESNAIILSWPVVFDNSDTSYRSGVKFYSLHRSTAGAGFTPDASNRIWKHYQSGHFPDFCPGFGPGGDKFKIEGDVYYFWDAGLAGGNTYYYKLVVEDYAGNSAGTDAADYTLTPPEYDGVTVTLTPTMSTHQFTLIVTTVDQYGNPFAISPNPTNGEPNVTFAVYENGEPADYLLYDLDAQENFNSDTFQNVSTRTYHVTYRPSESCISFQVYVSATHHVPGYTPVTRTANTNTVTIDRAAPPLPGNLRAPSYEITMTSINVRWNAAVDACTGTAYYKVYGKKATDPSYTLLASPSGLLFSHSNLQIGTEYRYYVTAVDAVDFESPVNPEVDFISATTLSDIEPPTVPTGLTAVYDAGYTYITLSWNLSYDALSGVAYYEVQKKLGDGGLWNTFQLVTHPNASLIDYQSYPGYKIYYRVRAVDLFDNASGWSAEAIADRNADTTPPTVPQILTSQALSSSSIVITWSASSDSGSGLKLYRVYRDYGPTPIAETTSQTYTNTGLSPNTTYAYQVSAVDNANNESAKSTAVSVQTPPPENQPNPPNNPRYTERYTDSLVLAWDPPTPNGTTILNYRVYRHTSMDSPPAAGTIVAIVTGTTATVTGLTHSTTYYFTVTALSTASVESNHSERISVSTKTILPTAPTNLRAPAVGGTYIELAWDASTPPPGSTITQYDLAKVVVNPWGESYFWIYNGSQLTYRYEGLSPNTEYKFKVRARDSAGRLSEMSTPVLAIMTPQDDPTPPPIPANLAANPLSSISIRVSWDAVVDTGGSGLAGYELFMDGDKLTTTTSTYHVVENLQPATIYSFQVQAADKAGNLSGLSPAVQAATFGLTDDLMCAHVTSTADWKTRFTLINIGDEAKPVLFYAFNADGELLETHEADPLAPQAALDVDADAVFAPETLAQDIWVKISSESKLRGVLTFGTRDDESLVTIPMFARGAADLIFPYVVTTDIWYTGITLINTGADQASPFIRAFTEKGEYLTGKVVSIPANGKFVCLVDQIFTFEHPEDIKFLSVESDKALIGFEVFGSFIDKGLAGLPAFSPTVELFKAEAKPEAKGDTPLTRPSRPTGFEGTAISESEIYLSWNPNPEPDLNHYAIYSNDGPVPNLIATTDQTHYTRSGLAPQTTYRFSLQAVNQGNEESESTTPILVTTLAQGQQDYPYRVYYNEIPDRAFYDTGITFSNLGAQAVTVHLSVYDANGDLLAENERPVAVLEQMTRYIENFFDNALPEGAAYLKVGATEKLLGFELFWTADELAAPFQFDGVIGVGSGATLHHFPLVRTGAEWFSRVRLTNIAASENDFTIEAFAADGTLLGTVTDVIPPLGKYDEGLETIFPDVVDQIVWIQVESDQQLIGDLFYFSEDLTRLSAYIGLRSSAE
ncbi:MAG: fibronectin type III domain-containing protein [Acidobacteria bacterium]|nr:fibronectin type III domain-containing protein [Acidobacteriota bacterium]